MRRYRIETYRAADGWRWRAKAANGRIVATSAEGYGRMRDAVKGARAAAGVLATRALKLMT